MMSVQRSSLGESEEDDVYEERMGIFPIALNGTNISECSSYVYLGRKLNMMNDLAPELGRRRRAAWGASKSIKDVVKKNMNTRLRAYLFNSTVLRGLTYASETCSLRKQDEHAVGVIERAIERETLGVSRFTQVRKKFGFRPTSKLEDHGRGRIRQGV